MTTFSDIAGANVRGLREQNGWTRDDLAARCAVIGYAGMTAAMITNIELGRRDKAGKRRRDVTVDELVVLADALSVPASALLPALTDRLDDLTLHAAYGFDVDDMIERLSALKAWTKGLEEKAAKDIFGFKRPDRLPYLKARWLSLLGSLKNLESRRAEVEREIAGVREAVEKIESGQADEYPAVVRRVLEQLEQLPGED